jgi:hypothetical protein
MLAHPEVVSDRDTHAPRNNGEVRDRDTHAPNNYRRFFSDASDL